MLEVELYGYSNPTGRCRGCLVRNTDQSLGGCCDQFTATSCTNELRCDSFFTFCLESERGGCLSGTEQRSDVNINDGFLNFSQSSVLGLENPLIISGSADPYTVSELTITNGIFLLYGAS